MSLDTLLTQPRLSPDDLLYLLRLEQKADLQRLYAAAYRVKEQHVGKKAYYRGLIEFSNVCVKDCLYCGIRKSADLERFAMDKAEILEMADWAWRNHYGSVTLQSGERQDAAFVDFVAEVIADIKAATKGELAMTLCLGEQTEAAYRKWFEAGAHRYLLRIETTSPRLYRQLHPADCDFETRVACLGTLKKIGYQVGTGVMVGLPGQTEEDLVQDILFYEAQDIDMIGMGPYVVHSDTPLGQATVQQGLDTEAARDRRFQLSLKMIAATRLYLRDVNIAATTALQALNPLGRELGLKAGANILMPIITLKQHRRKYQLYDNKPCLDDDQEHCKECLTARVRSVGDEVGFSEWGDSPHFGHKKNRA